MSQEAVNKSPSGSGTSVKQVPASTCPQNPPCSTCNLLTVKSNCPCTLNSKCDLTPRKCSLANIMSYKPSCCSPAPRCPPSPLCGSTCPPPVSCCSPSLCCPPRYRLPPRCVRCCEVTGLSMPPLSPMCPPRKSCCDPPICPPPSCCPPRPDPCCLPRPNPCCLPRPDPCCRPSPCCPPPPCPCPCPPPPCDGKPKEEEKEPEKDPEKHPEEAKPDDPCPKSPPPVHKCPSDVELERPKAFTESITGPATWQQYGVRIFETDPISPGTSTVKLGQPLTVTVTIEVKESSCLSADIISAYCWTHMKTVCNPCGTWKDLPLHYQKDKDSKGECGAKRYVYSSTLTPTVDDTFRVTFNIKWGNTLIWANNYGDDNMVGVGQ